MSRIDWKDVGLRQAEGDALLKGGKPVIPSCPVCGSDDTQGFNVEANGHIPDTHFWSCYACDHQWGHE